LSRFAVVGGTLGFLAFFRDTFASIAAANKEKWKVVEVEVLSEDTLLDMVENLSALQAVDASHLAEVELMLDWIEEDAIELQFKHLLRDPFKTYLTSFARDARNFIDSMKRENGPWRYYPTLTIPGPPDYYRIFPPHLPPDERKSLEERFHMVSDEAAQFVKAMRISYRKIKALAERECFEFIAPWKW